jgi:ribosomal protein S18 acetylase RimI-like enzyme
LIDNDGQIYRCSVTKPGLSDEPILATLRDIPQLLKWIQQLYSHDSIQFDTRKVRRALRELIDNPAFGRIWILTRDGQPAGYMVVTFGYSIEFGGRDAFIDELFVAEPHRHRSVGTRALQFATRACRELGIPALHLEVDRSNTGAQRLYRAMDFVDHDRYLMTRALD